MDCKEEILQEIRYVQNILSSTVLKLSKLHVIEQLEWVVEIDKDEKSCKAKLQDQSAKALDLKPLSPWDDGRRAMLKKKSLLIRDILEQNRKDSLNSVTTQVSSFLNISPSAKETTRFQDDKREQKDGKSQLNQHKYQSGISVKNMDCTTFRQDTKELEEQGTVSPVHPLPSPKVKAVDGAVHPAPGLQLLPLSEPKEQEGAFLSKSLQQLHRASSPVPMAEPKEQEGAIFPTRLQLPHSSSSSSGRSDSDESVAKEGALERIMVDEHPVGGLDKLFHTGHFDREVFKKISKSKELERNVFSTDRRRVDSDPILGGLLTPTSFLKNRQIQKKKINEEQRNNARNSRRSSVASVLQFTVNRIGTEPAMDIQIKTNGTEGSIPKGKTDGILPRAPRKFFKENTGFSDLQRPKQNSRADEFLRRKAKLKKAANSQGKLEKKQKTSERTSSITNIRTSPDLGHEASSPDGKNAPVANVAKKVPKEKKSGLQMLKDRWFNKKAEHPQILHQHRGSIESNSSNSGQHLLYSKGNGLKNAKESQEKSRSLLDEKRPSTGSVRKASAEISDRSSRSSWKSTDPERSDRRRTSSLINKKRGSFTQELNEVSNGMKMLSKTNQNKHRDSTIVTQKSPFFWIWFYIFLATVTLMAIHIPIALASAYTSWADYHLEVVIEMVFLLDIVVQSRTSYVDEWTKEEILDATKIAGRYFSSFQFFLDAAGSIPVYLIYGSQPSTFFFFGRLLKLLRVTRVAKMMGNIEVYNDKLNPAVLRMARVLLIFILLLHLVTCTYWFLGRMDQLSTKSWIVGNTMEIFETYGQALHFSVSVLAGNTIGAEQWQEHYFVAFCLILSIIINATVIGNATTIVSNMDSNSVEKKKQIDCIVEYMKKSKIPMDLQKRIRGYYDYLWDIGQASYSTRMLRDLPSKLALELNITLKKHLLDTCPLMKSMTPKAILTLLQSLTSRVVLPKELVVKQGERAMAMYFIARGSVSIWMHGKKSPCNDIYLTTLMEGAIFGEGGLLKSEGKHSRRNATVISETFCELLMLQKQQFQALVKTCPSFFLALKRVKSDRVESTRNAMQKQQPYRRTHTFPAVPEMERKPSLLQLSFEELFHRKHSTLTASKSSKRVLCTASNEPPNSKRKGRKSSLSSLEDISESPSPSAGDDSDLYSSRKVRSRTHSKVKSVFHAARSAVIIKNKTQRNSSLHKTFPAGYDVQRYTVQKSLSSGGGSSGYSSARQSLYEDIVQHHHDLISHSMADELLIGKADRSPDSSNVSPADGENFDTLNSTVSEDKRFGGEKNSFGEHKSII